MPLYEYLCPKGHLSTEFRAVHLRSNPLSCTICGHEAVKAIVTPPRVFGDLEGYESPASGKWIEGRRARADDFVRTGSRAWEPGDDKVAARNRVAIQAKNEALIDDAVMKTASELGIPTT